MVRAPAKVTPPVSTVTSAVLPSAMVAGLTVRRNAVWSLAEMVTCPVSIGAAPWLAAIVMVSRGSISVSSSAVMVAVPAVAPAASVMFAGAIV